MTTDEKIDPPKEHNPNVTIEGYVQTINQALFEKNTITEQEFIQHGFIALYNDDMLKSTNRMELEKIVAAFQVRFSMFDPIRVTDSLGQLIYELAPSLVSPNTWNKHSDTSLGSMYTSAMERQNPLFREDQEVIGEIVEVIDKSTNVKGLANLVMFKHNIESKYKDRFKQPSTEGVEPIENTEGEITDDTKTERLSIDSSGLF